MVELDQVPPEHRAMFSGHRRLQMSAWEEAFGKTLPASHKDSLNICSFSGTKQSIIMWSHYADQHRGYCIEYDTDSLPPEHLFVRMLYPVIYSEKLFDGTTYYFAALRNRADVQHLIPGSCCSLQIPGVAIREGVASGDSGKLGARSISLARSHSEVRLSGLEDA